MPQTRTIHGIALLVVLCLGFSSQALARDPALRWWTLRTPHFHVHFQQGAEQLASQVARDAEQALARVSKKLGHRPSGRIELVISDATDSANGFASLLPYNHIEIFATPPDDMSELHDHDGHLRQVLIHELAHLAHMDKVTGLPSWINLVLGRTVFPNGAQPGWFTEGLAVHTETSLSSAGRIRSSLFRMYLRTAALAGRFPTLDEMTGDTKRWPQGNNAYLFGGFFVQYLADRFGEQALTALSQHMSGMLIPWALNMIARKVMGLGYPELFDSWRSQVVRQAEAKLAELEREGLSASRPLTNKGQRQLAPRISPGGGQVLYYSAPRDDWPKLRLIAKDGSADRMLLKVNSEGGAAFDPAGQFLIFAQAEIYQQFYVFNDLYRFDLVTGRVRRLTHGARSRSPDVSPDGRRVVFSRGQLGANQLMELDLADLRIRPLTQPEQGRPVYTPRYDPRGGRVVYSQARPDGGRDLILIDLGSGQTRALTNTRTMDMQPAFTPDGSRIVFASDRTGIFNLYAFDLGSDRITRLTNLVTGAFSPDPAPDGSGIAYVEYGPEGFDVVWMDWPSRERPAVISRTERPQAPAKQDEQIYPVEAYRPWWSLLPRAWMPTWGEDAWGTTVGLMFGGQDVLGKISYLANLSYGPQNNQLYVDFSLSARLFYPSLSMYVGRHAYRVYNQTLVNGRSWSFDQEQIGLFAELSFPFSSVRQHHGLFINYDLRLFDRWTEIPRDPMDLEPILPDDSPLAWVGLGWYFSQHESYIDSISTERGVSASVSVRYSHPELGSGSQLAEARFWFRGFVPVVPSLHHVLAFGLQAGMAIGDERRRGLFSVGGLPIRDPLRDAYFGYHYGGLHLRGYEPGAFTGSAYLIGSVEYRLPIWIIERGLWSLPFFLRQLHAGVFVDFGGASPEPDLDTFVDEMLKVGVGAELRLDMLLAYYLPFSLRVGYGRGLSTGGVNNYYLTLGSGF